MSHSLNVTRAEAAEYASDKEQTRRMLQSYEREFDSIMGKLVGAVQHVLAVAAKSVAVKRLAYGRARNTGTRCRVLSSIT
jgi:hypothetical protein